MQQWTNPQQMRAYQPARNIMTYTLLCFSLAGLIFGFAVGGFWGRSPSATGQVLKSTPIVHRTASPTATATTIPEDTALGLPDITHISSSEVADGTTSYTLSAQAVFKTTPPQPINMTDVVCRLWLTQDSAGTIAGIGANNNAVLRDIASITQNQPAPQEVPPGTMNFTTPSTQVQPCVANGLTTWTYTLAPGIPPGTYYLFVLTDWKGHHFPWSYQQIHITAPQ